MKNLIPILFGSVLGIVLAAFITVAYAKQTQLSPGQAASISAPCTYAGATTQAVAVTATTAKTSTATGVGKARLVCTASAHFVQGLAGVTGVTATTGDSYLPLNVIQEVSGNASTFAFVRATADGTCFVTECK